MRQPNTTYDVYLAGSLPPAAPDATAQRGFLKDRFQHGQEANEGDLTFLWTATLEVPLSANLPDGYPSGAFATTVWFPDKDGTAYTVIFTERERDFRGKDFKRVYLIKGVAVALTVEELDGTPSYTFTTKLIVDQTDGFTLSQPAAHQVRLDLASATTTQKGAVDGGAQSFAGLKTFTNNIVSEQVNFLTNSYIKGVLDFDTDTVQLRSSDGVDSVTMILNASGTGGYAGGALLLVAGWTSGFATAFPQIRLQNSVGSLAVGKDDTAAGMTFTSGLWTSGSFTLSTGDIPGLDEAIDDRVASLLVAGTGVTLSYNDAANTLTISSSVGSYTNEEAQDAVFNAITMPAAGLSGTYSDGANTFTFALTNDLAALEALSSTGIACRTASDTWAQRTLTAGSAVSVSNGNGVSGNPTVAVDITGLTAITSSSGVDVSTDMLLLYDDSAAANKKIAVRYIQALIESFVTPPGLIIPFGGSSVPSGYLECDGSAVSRTVYANLFAAVSTTWGSGDGSSTFNVPDLRGRALIGAGTGSGLTARTLGTTGGNETHTLASSEMPSHSHQIKSPNGSTMYTTGGGAANNVMSVVSAGISGANHTTESAGSGGSHNNMQPWAAVKYLIKT